MTKTALIYVTQQCTTEHVTTVEPHSNVRENVLRIIFQLFICVQTLLQFHKQ